MRFNCHFLLFLSYPTEESDEEDFPPRKRKKTSRVIGEDTSLNDAHTWRRGCRREAGRQWLLFGTCEILKIWCVPPNIVIV